MNRTRKGTAGERDVIERLEEEGWECYKSAASAGTFDVIALKQTQSGQEGTHSVRLIQVKRFGERRGYGVKTLLESLMGWTGHAWVSAWLAERQDGCKEWQWTEARRSD